ncbi:MAG: hypothetical protein MRY21_03550 [Simkaniaceae bacterium]|nr:hypothetical protein [Simkaniaceae bacterium]
MNAGKFTNSFSDMASDQHSLSFSSDISITPMLFDESENKHSNLFFKQGERLLLKGDHSGVKFFDMAADLDPSNAQLLYDQGLALFEFGSEEGKEKNLLLASRRFKKCTSIEPTYFHAWVAWGAALYALGKATGEAHYFHEAKTKLHKATTLVEEQPRDLVTDLLWKYGLVMTEIAILSQEVSDLNGALEAFNKALEIDKRQPSEFWVDLGRVYFKLGQQINDSRLFVKAIECFKQAVTINLSNFQGWHLMAQTLTRLYDFTHDEDHFTQANECYATAAQLSAHDSGLWLGWASMLKESGKRLCDTKRLHSAIEKCHRAYACDSLNLRSIGIWAESLAALGVLQDRLDLLQEAENKICEAIDDRDAGPEIYYAYGMVYYAYGTYFEDIEHYYQAIEKFQEGISIDRTYHRLWYALGITHAQTAELQNDPKILERACKFFSRAIGLSNVSSYYYEYALALSKLGEYHRDKNTIELAIIHFEQALNLQKNAIYLHPEWLYQYAVTLDTLADYTEDENHYARAIEILGHVLVVDPEHPEVHYRLALCCAHYAELTNEIGVFQRATSHFKLAYKKDSENDIIILDWALTLISMAEIADSLFEREQWLKEAEYKIVQAAKLGNVQAYYHLACLYSITQDFSRSIHFLQKAYEFSALPPLDEILNDSWLDNLRETDFFKAFLSEIQTWKPNTA